MTEEAASIAPPEDNVESATDVVVAAFDGDMRAAIRSLLIANEFLIAEVDRLRSSLSVGYVRSRRQAVGNWTFRSTGQNTWSSD